MQVPPQPPSTPYFGNLSALLCCDSSSSHFISPFTSRSEMNGKVHNYKTEANFQTTEQRLFTSFYNVASPQGSSGLPGPASSTGFQISGQNALQFWTPLFLSPRTNISACTTPLQSPSLSPGSLQSPLTSSPCFLPLSLQSILNTAARSILSQRMRNRVVSVLIVLQCLPPTLRGQAKALLESPTPPITSLTSSTLSSLPGLQPSSLHLVGGVRYANSWTVRARSQHRPRAVP